MAILVDPRWQPLFELTQGQQYAVKVIDELVERALSDMQWPRYVLDSFVGGPKAIGAHIAMRPFRVAVKRSLLYSLGNSIDLLSQAAELATSQGAALRHLVATAQSIGGSPMVDERLAQRQSAVFYAKAMTTRIVAIELRALMIAIEKEMSG